MAPGKRTYNFDLDADIKHRARCEERQGSAQCICADYAAITGQLHPDCPEHGYDSAVSREERLQ